MGGIIFISGTKAAPWVSVMSHYKPLISSMMTAADGCDRMILLFVKPLRSKGEELLQGNRRKLEIDKRSGSFNLARCIKSSKICVLNEKW